MHGTQTPKTHATHGQADQNNFWKLNPNELMYVHPVHNQHDPNFTEMHENYINRFILHHTSHIQHQFHLILTTSKESSKTSSNIQTSNHDNSLNIA